MYTVEIQPYGYHHRISGRVTAAEIKAATESSKHLLSTGPKNFGVLVDMRGFKVMLPEEQRLATEIMALYKKMGMSCSVVILDNAIATLQLKRLAKESGIDRWECYIDSSVDPNWEAKALAWLTDGAEPAS